jgi:hypothetical protein
LAEALAEVEAKAKSSSPSPSPPHPLPHTHLHFQLQHKAETQKYLVVCYKNKTCLSKLKPKGKKNAFYLWEVFFFPGERHGENPQEQKYAASRLWLNSGGKNEVKV